MAVIYETLNRANEAVLTTEIFGEAEGKALYENYIAKRYIYLPLCMDVLKTYQANRDKYAAITGITKLLAESFLTERNKKCGQ